MSRFLLVRIDDRLLHGQVALGWRHRLDPRAFWIVDATIAQDPFARLIYEAALPEGTALEIFDASRFLDAIREEPGLSRTVLLVRGLPEMRRLCEGGFRPPEVNLGGVHARPGAKKVLDYLYLTVEDRAAAAWLIERGIDLFAQDLPSSIRWPVVDLLDGGGGTD